MKKKIKFILALSLALTVTISVCGCGDKGSSSDGQPNSEDLSAPTFLGATDSSAGGPDAPGGEPKSTGEPNQEIAKEVTVTIRENQVFINDTEFKEAGELKNYIESVNSDGMVFKIIEDHAIQATYEWVTGVFRELEIENVVTPNG